VLTVEAAPVPSKLVADILAATSDPKGRLKLPEASLSSVNGMLQVVPDMIPESAPSQ
jgi:hypothetical protein